MKISNARTQEVKSEDVDRSRPGHMIFLQSYLNDVI
jgi:hypothetical protein